MGLSWALLGLSWAFLAFQGVPRLPRASQGVPGRFRTSQGVPGRPRACQNDPGSPRMSQGVPGCPRISQGLRRRPRVSQGALVREWGTVRSARTLLCGSGALIGGGLAQKKKNSKQKKPLVPREVARLQSVIGLHPGIPQTSKRPSKIDLDPFKV